VDRGVSLVEAPVASICLGHFGLAARLILPARLRRAQITYLAARDISAGEELTIFYGDALWFDDR
jgi:hypothetical protein